MGQVFDRVNISCIDCSSNLATQEDIFSEASSKSILKQKVRIEEALLDKAIHTENPLGEYEFSNTQPSIKYPNTSKDSEQAVRVSTSYKMRRNSIPLNKEKTILTSNAILPHQIDHDSANSSISSVNNSAFLNSSKYKTRSSNFSCVSLNLVDSLRSTYEPPHKSYYN